MTCLHRRTETTLAVTTARGSRFVSASRGWAFPATFIQAPAVAATVGLEYMEVISGNGSVTTTEYNHYICSDASVTITANVEFAAIGRWY